MKKLLVALILALTATTATAAGAEKAEAVWASTSNCPIGSVWANNTIVGRTAYCWATTVNTGKKSVRVVIGCTNYQGGTAYVNGNWRGLGSSQQKTGTSVANCQTAIGGFSRWTGYQRPEWSSFNYS